MTRPARGIDAQMTTNDSVVSGKAVRASFFDITSRSIDFVLKLTPIYMLLAGAMLWVHLAQLGWVSLLLPSATSASGLAFLAVSALAFMGAVIVVLLLPSFLLLSCSDIYLPERSMPQRVKWILLATCAAWSIGFGLIGVSDKAGEILTLPRLIIGGMALGVAGYALPGIVAVIRRSDGSCLDVRNKFLERWSLALQSHGKAVPGSMRGGARMNAPARGGFVLPNLERQPEGSAGHGKARRFLGAVFLPLWLIWMIWSAAFLTSLPVLVLGRLFGDTIESTLGAFNGWILLVVAGMLTMLPAFTYLHARSQGADPNASAKQAFIAALLLAMLTLVALPYAPIKDRVFSLLEIQSTEKSYFQISSPSAAAALENLGFAVADIPPERGKDGKEAATPGPAKMTFVYAWVGYAFGDTVLLCKRQVSAIQSRDPLYKDPIFLDAKRPANTCMPLQRADLRRVPEMPKIQ